MPDTLPLTILDAPLRTVIGDSTISTARIRPRSWTSPPDERPRWETIVTGPAAASFSPDVEEWTYSPENALALHARRVADVERIIVAARKPDPLAAFSDADLERAHFALLNGRLDARTRDILAVLDSATLPNDRCRNLFAALVEWDEAGARTPQDRRDHEQTYCRIAAVLVDALLAYRESDPGLVGELAASVGVL